MALKGLHIEKGVAARKGSDAKLKGPADTGQPVAYVRSILKKRIHAIPCIPNIIRSGNSFFYPFILYHYSLKGKVV